MLSMPDPDDIASQLLARLDDAAMVQELADTLLRQGRWMATAESCTGGKVAALCTSVAGSSGWFECGVVSYSNRAKEQLLGVPAALITQHGAVSEAVAVGMAQGLCDSAPVDWVVAITGIAGPGGGSADKPVGTVCFAWAGPDGVDSRRRHFDGDRAAVRDASTSYALAGLLARL